jgi:hypothetical protein
VRIAKPGTYTAKATLEGPEKPFTAEVTFTVPESWAGGGEE